MQTNFRGRDFIGDLDFSKEEVETVLDVAWDLQTQTRVERIARFIARQDSGDAVLLH